MPCLRWQTVSASWSMVASSRPAVWPQFVLIPQYAKPISAKARPMADTSLLELRHRDELRIESRIVWNFAHYWARRDGFAARPQRHGQDHDRALDHGLDAAGGWLRPLRRRGDPQPSHLSDRQARHWPRPRRAPNLPKSYRSGEPDCDRGELWRHQRTVDTRKGPGTVPAACRARRHHGQFALRRRTANARHRPFADDQPASLNFGRSDRRPSAAGA